MTNSNFINKAYGYIKRYIDSMNGFNSYSIKILTTKKSLQYL